MPPACLALVAERARTTPDAPAFRGPQASRTYGELWADAQAAASRQRDAGLQAGDRFLHAGDDQLEAVIWFLACCISDTVLVPVSASNPGWVERVAATTGVAARTVASAVVLEQEPGRRATEEGTRAVLRTSGSTGESRGVLVDDRMIDAATATAIDVLELGPKSTFLNFLPAHTVGQLFLAALPTLAAGGTVASARFAPHAFGDALDELEPTVTILLPIMIRMLEVRGALGAGTLRDLDTVGCGASTVPREAATAVLEAGAARFVHLFGATEALTPIFARATSDPDDDDAVLLDGPLGDVDAQLSDEGELLLRGSAVARSYDEPNATEDGFAAGYLRTGDLFTRVGESWAFVGRRDDQLKVNDYSVSPAMTERVVLGVPGVEACAVTKRPHRLGAELLVCLIQGDFDRDAVLEACRARLDAPQVPARIVKVDQVPHNAMGKIDRTSVVQLLTAP